MPQMLISYDLTGDEDKKETFLETMIGYGWSDHIQRGSEFERLPNTTLISNLDAEAAVRSFRASANKASLDGSDRFDVTHWTITGFNEVEGGVRKAKKTTAAEVLKSIR